MHFIERETQNFILIVGKISHGEKQWSVTLFFSQIYEFSVFFFSQIYEFSVFFQIYEFSVFSVKFMNFLEKKSTCCG